MIALSTLNESSYASIARSIDDAGGTPMLVSRYEHANDYNGQVVACLEYTAAYALLATLRASAVGAEVYDICEA